MPSSRTTIPLDSCPDIETLAAYADGALSPEERAQFEAHAASCDQCYAVLVDVVRTRHTGTTSAATRTAKIVGAAIALAAALILAVRLAPGVLERLRSGGAEGKLQRLIDAVGDDRLVEGRLAGGFKYQPLVTTRSAQATQNLSLVAAAGEWQKAVKADASPANLHGWGLAELLLGAYDEAITNLKDAAAQAPTNAEYQSDCAAALIARATASPGMQSDLPRAIEFAEKARRLAPSMPEAWFNWALALQRSNLSQPAQDAWNEYLRRDGRSGWADDARVRLEELRTPRKSENQWQGLTLAARQFTAGMRLPAINPEVAAQLIEEELLPAWAGAWRAGRAEDEPLDRIVAFARMVGVAQGDRLLPESAERLYAATRDPHSLDVNRLAAGYEALGMMKRAFADAQMGQMETLASRCVQELEAAHSPMALWCGLYEAVGAFYEGKRNLARSRAEALYGRVPQTFPILRAQLGHLLAGLAFIGSDYQTAIQLSLPAIDALENAHASWTAVEARQTAAAAYGALGEARETWRHYIPMLATPVEPSQVRRRHSLLISAGNSALRLGQAPFAFVLLAQAASEARASRDPGRQSEAHVSIARAQEKMGLHREAAANLQEASRLVLDIKDSGVARRFQADLQFAEAEALTDTDPAAAARGAEAALAGYRGLDIHFREGQIKLYRARAALRLHDRSGAETALLEALTALDAERALIDQPPWATSFAEISWEIHRELITFYLSDGRQADALLALEHARRSFDFTTVRRRHWLPAADREHTAYVVFAELNGKFFGWLVVNGQLRTFDVHETPDMLERTLQHLSSALRVRNSDDTTSILSALHSTLLGPVRPHLANTNRLVILADGVLSRVPFAALIGPTSRYLVQDVEIVVARALSSYAAAVEREAHAPAVPLDAWVLCDPTNTRTHLAALPGASQEGAIIAKLYAKPAVSCGESATKEAFMQALVRARVIHFAGHAVTDPVDPWSSRLIVSPTHDNPLGILSLREIVKSRPSSEVNGARLVVLAACSTAWDGSEGSREAVSAAFAFTRIGIPWVIAAQWALDDRAAEELFTRVHASIAERGASPAAALRAAQMAMIERKAPPAAWAGVVAVAGGRSMDDGTSKPPP